MKEENIITIEMLIDAYCSGFFPMADEMGEVLWYNPDPRAIIPFENYRVSKSLKPILNKKQFDIQINGNFEQVMRYCAAPRKEEDQTWINEEIIQLYVELHRMGLAHSVEAYREGRLVGGLYGVCLGGAFFGESMFSLESNSSKVAFHYLIQLLKSNGFSLLDSQFMNDNVKRYGAIEITRTEYLARLHEALPKNCAFQLP
ncbi:leucyl/phenylalanyl-tRNA--protein transferase [Aquirufa sp. ROCK2-A2]